MPSYVTFSDLDRRIIAELAKGDLGFSRIMMRTKSKRTTVSDHLTRLHALGFVHTYITHVDKRGRPPRYYGLTEEGHTFFNTEMK